MLSLAGAAMMVWPRPVAAQAHTSVGFAVGATIPTGAYGSDKNVGYHAGPSLHVPIGALPVELRIDGNFTEMKYSGNSTKAQIWAASGNLLARMPTGTVITPYVVGGFGIYNAHRSLSLRNSAVTKLGANAGGGLRLALHDVALFLEARYHRAGGTDGIQMVPITLGVMF
jgi:hypothetical protein